MFAKPFLLKPRTVKDTGIRKTVLDEPYTLAPEGGALLLKEFPARVKVGDPLFQQSSGAVLSPVNGVASLAREENGTKIRITQDGTFPSRKEPQPKRWNKQDACDAMDSLGIVSLDYCEKPLSSFFRNPVPPKIILLSPYTRTQNIDFCSRLSEMSDCHLAFLQALADWFPGVTIRDYISDKKPPVREYSYPWGIPEYFAYRTERIPFQKFSEALYLGPETLYHLYKALFSDFPFIERDASLFFLGKNGGLRKAQKPLAFRNGQNLKFLFEEFRNDFRWFTLNSFYENHPVRSVGESFYFDIRLHSSLILLARHDSNRSEFPCVECGECSLNCPTKANPMALVGFRGKFQPGLCMECGICTFVCPSSISLRDRIRSCKEDRRGV